MMKQMKDLEFGQQWEKTKYDSYFQEEKNLKTAKIDTAFELSNEQLDSIKVVLEKRFNKK